MAVPQYATADELDDFLGTTYTVPASSEVTRLLQRASELVSHYTIGLAAYHWHVVSEEYPADQYTDGLRDATCAEVEFWLEVGEEHDIVGLIGAVASGKLHISDLPQRLAPRAKMFLTDAGLLHGRAGVR